MCSGFRCEPLRRARAGAMVLGLARFCDGEGNGTPLQYSCLENPMDRGAWWAVVHGVAKSQIRLSDFTFTLRFHALEKEMALHSSVLALRIPGTGKPGWAAVYGVAQSRTRLKRLSSSGSSSTCFPLLPHARTMSGYRSIPSLKSLKNNQGKR